MARAAIAPGMALLLLAQSGAARAQEEVVARVPTIEQGIRFTLKPRATPTRLPSPPTRAGHRMRSFADSPDRIAVDDPGHDVQVAVQRRTLRFAGGGAAALDRPVDAASPYLFLPPRSRFTRLSVEDHLPLGEHVSATLGWQGVKLSNRNANSTVGAGDDRLRARDWFLPRAALHVSAGPALALGVDYAETLRAYGDTGTTGPLGLTREEFRGLRRTLRPETHSRLRLTADWTPAAPFDLSLAAYGGRLDDRLSFAEASYQPVNSGSARIEGGSLTIRHRLSPHLLWSARYEAGRLHLSDGATRRERKLAIEGVWTGGAWRGMVRAVRASAPLLTADRAAERRGGLRMEAGLDYAADSLCRCPLRIAARLTDPDRLAIGAFGDDRPAGPARATDQARALMFSAALDW